jgi:hypothetical protein
MAEMAKVTGAAAAMATLPAPVLTEMAGLCAACPRTDACLQWLAAQDARPASPAADLCPNHATFDMLAARAPSP